MNIFLSTWFYSSPLGENIYYPGVGSNSDSWDFQKIYWNCIYTFFESHSIHTKNSEFSFRNILFLNQDPPTKDLYPVNDFDPKNFFERNKIEIIKFNPAHVPSAEDLETFRTQFVMIDIMKEMENVMKDDDLFLILDSDCLFIKEIPSSAIHELKEVGIQYMKNGWGSSDVSNGLTNNEFNKIIRQLNPSQKEELNYFSGGEFFGFNKKMLVKFNALASSLYDKNFMNKSPLQTEEQLFTLILDLIGNHQYSDASVFIKRVWTDQATFRTANELDKNLSVLHLPAEKNRGFHKFAHDFIFGSNPQKTSSSYDEMKPLFNLA